MSRIAPVLLCLLLLFGAVCPAFCLQQSGVHQCCHTKTAGTLSGPCGHSGLAQTQSHPFSAALTATRVGEATRRLFSDTSLASLPAIAGAPRPQASPHRILRI
jgi:hypothetical protein